MRQDELAHDDGHDDALPIGSELLHVVGQGVDDAAVGAVDDVEGHREAGPAPVRQDLR